MKRFRFRLERLLHLRQSEQRQHVMALAEKRRHLDQCAAAVESACRRLAEIQGSYGGLTMRPTSAEELMTSRQAIDRTEEEISRGRKTVRKAEVEVETAREHLREKSRDVETLVRLRRKRWEEHALTEGRRDQTRIDAIAVQQYTIKSLPTSA